MKKVGKLFQVVRTVKNWPTYLLDYLKLIPRREIVYRLRNGVCFNIQTHTYDALALAEVWMQRVYTPVGDELAPESIVVDLGANIGLFSVLAGRLASRGRVFAFEPMPVNFSNLKRNIALNGLSNIVPIEAALGGSTTDRNLFVGENDTVSHSLSKSWGGNTAVKVRCFTLADAMREWGIPKIDFLKVDCETAEVEIFAACSEAVFRAIGTVSMEVHEWPGSDNTGLLKQLFEARQFDVDTSSSSFVAKNRLPIVPLEIGSPSPSESIRGQDPAPAPKVMVERGVQAAGDEAQSIDYVALA